MITKIKIKEVASYKEETCLETDKKVNLVYGLNGSGKTTLSNYLQNLDEDEFNNFEIEGFNENTQKILVYNQRFVEKNFYENETQKGIFTLAEGNKEAKNNIDNAQKEKSELDKKLNDGKNELNKKKQNIDGNVNSVKNKIWKIKDKFTGGDRVFDIAGFLDGLKGAKKNLFDYLIEVESSNNTKTLDEIKKELQELGEAKENRQPLEDIQNNQIAEIAEIENNQIFQESIIGNENSTVASLINKFKNSDWVKTGLGYVNLQEGKNCPFCQQETLTEDLVSNIKNYFDETYENKKQEIVNLKLTYENIKSNLNIENYKRDFYTEKQNLEIENLFKNLHEILDDNFKEIEGKISQPSQSIELKSSREVIKEINDFIDIINKEIKNFNQKLADKEKTIQELKTEFWKTQRKEYDPIISDYQKQNKKLEKEKQKIEEKIKETNENIEQQKKIILDNQQRITNITETIKKINSHLLDFGIQDFEIVENDEQTYKIQRGEETDTKFKSLSEGEKTVISFLYFVELCIGKETQEDTKEKIIVIDDPICSLSHMYIFNVAELIKQCFTRGDNNFEQIFILTHSLYFFHELVDKKDKQREEDERKQKLFRITKTDRSQIEEMEYNEIQNEYESYWHIVKTGKDENKFLVANAMRNIIEHFFGFVEKQDSINNIFQKEEFKDNKYQSFKRYIDRESHTNRTNISDSKEFDLNNFKDAFKKVFKEAGYEEHYEKFID